MIRAAYDFNGPMYIRFGRMATPVFHDENYRFEIGKGELLRNGLDVAIVATRILVTAVEEHNVIGGLGEAVCSLLAEKYPVPVKKIGVNDEFGHSGAAGDLLKQFGLCADNIVKQTEGMVRRHVD